MSAPFFTAVVPTEGEHRPNRQDLEFVVRAPISSITPAIVSIRDVWIWFTYSVGIVNGTYVPIGVRPKQRSFDGLQRIVCVWGWNIIGVIGIAIEGLLAFLSLAFVGLATFAFLVIRAKQLGRLGAGLSDPAQHRSADHVAADDPA